MQCHGDVLSFFSLILFMSLRQGFKYDKLNYSSLSNGHDFELPLHLLSSPPWALSPAHTVGPAVFQVGIPPSDKHPWKQYHRHTRRWDYSGRSHT